MGHRLSAIAVVATFLSANAGQAQDVPAAVLRVDYAALLPVSRLDLPPDDRAFAGGELATADNNTSGQFLGQSYTLDTVAVPPDEALAALDTLREKGIRHVVVLARHDELLALSDAAGEDMLLFNASAPDTDLRDENCRANILHVAPSRAMLTDALAQFLVWKRWTNWALIHGSHPEDMALADSYRASAAKFGARIVATLEFEDTGGARRTDTGHVQVQRQLPVFTQDLGEHHVVIAADENDIFAVYLPYHKWDPSAVAGSGGLRPVSWHPAIESWGATQFQNRFEALAGRYMRDEDYNAWLALRVLGEAVTRTGSAEPAELRAYVLGDEFALAAFKGQPVTFRNWNGQMRQPIVLADGRLMVSVSPQEGFLHQSSLLDTLGLDRPESGCTAFSEGGN